MGTLAAIKMTERKVILYSQPGWHFCHLEKAWLSEQEIEFVDRNIAEDESTLKELQELVEFSTPVTLINREVLLRLITRTAISQPD